MAEEMDVDVDDTLPQSLFSGVFHGPIVDVTDRNVVRSYLSQIYAAKGDDDQVKLFTKRFHELARTSRVPPLSAQKIREEELRLNMLHFCRAPHCPLDRAGRRYNVFHGLGQYPCVREIDGPLREYGRETIVVHCAHSEDLTIGGTESVPLMLLLLHDAPYIHHSAVKSIRIVPLQPSGAPDLTRSVVRVRRLKTG